MASQSITPCGAGFWRIKHNALMKCSYRASVAEPPEQVWATFSDLDGLLAALPGATLARDGTRVGGSLKCSLGSAQITYRIDARAGAVDAKGHEAALEISGKEARGTGTITGSLLIAVYPEGSGAQVGISGEIEATGRGAAADGEAWSRVLSRLVDAALPGSTATPLSVSPPRPAPRPALAVAPAVGDFDGGEASRSGPPAEMIAGLVALLLLIMRRRRRRRRAKGEADDNE
jgi:carbon monoxide dehydrogenase subunit G